MKSLYHNVIAIFYNSKIIMILCIFLFKTFSLYKKHFKNNSNKSPKEIKYWTVNIKRYQRTANSNVLNYWNVILIFDLRFGESFSACYIVYSDSSLGRPFWARAPVSLLPGHGHGRKHRTGENTTVSAFCPLPMNTGRSVGVICVFVFFSGNICPCSCLLWPKKKCK